MKEWNIYSLSYSNCKINWSHVIVLILSSIKKKNYSFAIINRYLIKHVSAYNCWPLISTLEWPNRPVLLIWVT